jgi:hypothetical protein
MTAPDRRASWIRLTRAHSIANVLSEAAWSQYVPEDALMARDMISLDLFWLRDESLEDSANLPDPQVLAKEIANDLRSALEQIESVLGDLTKVAPLK